MVLSAAGLTHQIAPLRLRERVAVAEADLPIVLTQIRNSPGIVETLLVSTCNRVEIYAVSASPGAAAAAFTTFATRRGIGPQDLARTMVVLAEREAALHVVRVAAGLESMVVGEPQILGQVRRAYDVARRHRSIGPVLNRLMQSAIAAGRRVRQTTGLARHAASIPHAAAALAERSLGGLRGRTVLVIGAGELAGLGAKIFAARGARVAAVVNRTLETAVLLAERYGAAAVTLDKLPAMISGADVVLVAVGAGETVLSAEDLGRAAPPPAIRLVIDLSAPRAVAADVAGIPGTKLQTLEDLSGAGLPMPPPAADLAAAAAIAAQAAAAFLAWHASRAAAPVIAALTDRAERIAELEVRRARVRLAGLDEQQRETVRAVVLAALHKLLHVPIIRLRESVATGNSLLTTTEDLFGLDRGAEDEWT